MKFKDSEVIDTYQRFWVAVQQNDIDTVEAILAADNVTAPKPNVNHKMGITYPIIFALSKDYMHIVNELYLNEANLNLLGDGGWGFAHELVKKSPKLLNKLMGEVSFNCQNEHGVSPLLVALQVENWDTVEILSKSGKPIKAHAVLPEDGDTAAHILIKKGKLSLLMNFLENEESFHEAFVKNKEGNSPIDYIEDEAMKELIKEKVIAKAKEFDKKYTSGFSDSTNVEKIITNNVEAQPVVKDKVAETETKTVEPVKPVKLGMGMGGIKKNF